MSRRSRPQSKRSSRRLAARHVHHIGLVLAVLAIVVIFGFQTLRQGDASAAPANFVYRSGTKLMLNGSPYKFVGFNAFGMTGCEGTAWTDAQLDSYFSSLPPASMTRLWAFRPYGTGALDRIVASAESHNQKLILSLGNDLGDCDDSGNKTQTWYQSGYTATYLPWVKSTVARYKSSPAVGMWEILNEQGININNANNANHLDTTVAKNFFSAVAAAIKGVDPNHLVESGTVAEYVYAGGAADYQAVHNDPNIDVGSLHEYDYDYSGGEIISNHLSATKTAMANLGKPIIVGETGIMAGPSVTGTCHTTYATRASAFKQKLDGYLGSGVSGVTIWDRTMRSVVDCSDFYVSPGDPTIATVQNYLIPDIVATAPSTSDPTPTTNPTQTQTKTSPTTAPSTKTNNAKDPTKPSSSRPVTARTDAVSRDSSGSKAPSFHLLMSARDQLPLSSHGNKTLITSTLVAVSVLALGGIGLVVARLILRRHL